MIGFRVFIFVCIAVVLPSTSRAIRLLRAAPCDEIRDTGRNNKTCFLNSAAINSTDFRITSDRDESVVTFFATGNGKIEHLPANIGEKFPSIIDFEADSCSIKELSKANFEGLSELQGLSLQRNQIEKIDDDTFEYIPAVVKIHLTWNKIKRLNGRAFASLHRLRDVNLVRNECIDRFFVKPGKEDFLSQHVTEKCGFFELKNGVLPPCNHESCLADKAKLEAGLKAKSEEIQALCVNITMLETQAESQLAHHNEVEAQLKEACDAQIALKVQENANLSNDLQAKAAEINELTEKIKQGLKLLC